MLPQKVSEQLDSEGAPLWRRDHAGLFGGIEAKGDSALFKSTVRGLRSAFLDVLLTLFQTVGKPLAMNWDRM
jgi:hypothetical protein